MRGDSSNLEPVLINQCISQINTKFIHNSNSLSKLVFGGLSLMPWGYLTSDAERESFIFEQRKTIPNTATYTN